MTFLDSGKTGPNEAKVSLSDFSGNYFQCKVQINFCCCTVQRLVLFYPNSTSLRENVKIELFYFYKTKHDYVSPLVWPFSPIVHQHQNYELKIFRIKPVLQNDHLNYALQRFKIHDQIICPQKGDSENLALVCSWILETFPSETNSVSTWSFMLSSISWESYKIIKTYAKAPQTRNENKSALNNQINIWPIYNRYGSCR